MNICYFFGLSLFTADFYNIREHTIKYFYINIELKIKRMNVKPKIKQKFKKPSKDLSGGTKVEFKEKLPKKSLTS